MSQPEYAVMDTETTGLHPQWHHRVVEVAVVGLDHRGRVTDEWCTLVNPERDLGSQSIHGIRAADVRDAPRFADIAGDLVERIRGRVVAAHNWPFDAAHLRAEFSRLGIESPFQAGAGLCTMRSAARAMPGAGRSLVDCCRAIGLTDMHWHTARDDAIAAARLLAHLRARAPMHVRATDEQVRASMWPWPYLPTGHTPPKPRPESAREEPHFLARLIEYLPHDEEPQIDAYLAMLDDALLDRHLAVNETDALVRLATELGLSRAQAVTAHVKYLHSLACAAWADGTVTAEERHDLHLVAQLLGLTTETVDTALRNARPDAPQNPTRTMATPGGLHLDADDEVVFTGTMRHPRAELTMAATEAGLRVGSAVTKRTRVLVAADPDSLSGKARQARQRGIPVVTEDAFLRAIAPVHAR